MRLSLSAMFVGFTWAATLAAIATAPVDWHWPHMLPFVLVSTVLGEWFSHRLG